MATSYAELSREQKGIVDEILREGRRRKAPRKVIESAIETGLVESGLRNLGHGDADSQGWRQERRSLYPNPTNVKASVRRYYDEAMGFYKQNPGGTSGDLAARVQRPREDLRGKYEQRDADADRILATIGGGGLGAPGASTRTTTVTEPVQIGGIGEAGLAASNRADAVLGLLRGDSLLNFAMNVRAADQAAEQAAPTNALTTQRTTTTTSTQPTATTRHAAKGGDWKRPHGNFKGTEGPIIHLAQIAHELGVKTTSAKRDNQNPASGNRSDHHHGNTDATARDLSNGSAPTPQMDEAALRIARALGNRTYKKGQKLEMVTTINGIRYQVLYRTNTGGDHFDHVHVGAKRVG